MKKIIAFLLAVLLLTATCFFALAETAAEPAPAPAPVIDLTGLVVSIVVLIFEALLAWLLKAIIPPAKRWLNSHTTKNQQAIAWNVVTRLVEAAEQIITGKGKGDQKLQYVKARLLEHGYTIDPYLIEAAVKEMNDKSMADIAKMLEIKTDDEDDYPDDEDEDDDTE